MEFLKNVSIGQFVPGDSFLHRLDPRSKILLLFIIVFTIFFISWLPSYAILILLMIYGAALGNISVWYLIKSLRSILFLIILTLILNFFFTPGKPLEFIPYVKITYEGVILGLLMAARLVVLVMSASLLTLTTSPVQITDALESLLKPLKLFRISSYEIALIMTIALKFIPVLIGEAEKIAKAQMSRGLDIERGNIIKRMRNLVPIIVPLFVHAYKHSEELAIAMEARCYRGGEGRTRLKELRFRRMDFIAVVFTGAILVILTNL